MGDLNQNDGQDLVALRAERDSLRDFLGSITKQYEGSIAEMKRQFIEFSKQAHEDRRREPQRDFSTQQGDVMVATIRRDESDGGGALYAERYRNDTATGDPANIHRLERISRASAYDPAKLAAPDIPLTEADMNGDYAHDHPYMWNDELWTPVVGGEAVAYG